MDELRALYERADLTSEEKIAQRDRVFAASQQRFRTEVQPTFEALAFGSFLTLPLNNATLLSRMVYYHRLYDFDALLRANRGSVAAAVAAIAERADEVDDAYSLLPTTAATSPSPPPR